MTNITFIIPVRIDSPERHSNILTTVNYLLKHTDGNIIITENSSDKKLNFDNIPRITYRFQENKTPIFHRTKILNEMLSMVSTPITVNYDADVILPVQSYIDAQELILKNDFDIVYPFRYKQMDQVKIFLDRKDTEKFKNTFDLSDIIITNDNIHMTMAGHCQFIKTNSYKKAFMENENFIDWGPEDHERLYRFNLLGYKISGLNSKVYHQEHPPSVRNDLNYKNHDLWQYLKSLSLEDYKKYYQNQEYWKKYENCSN